ncbi:neurocan core protein-like [Ptychodera flava]|uniref:neurocan core protein-like n=1 Tax=Ptychodera flava TaxID=63121 RepID=UPI00396A14F2
MARSSKSGVTVFLGLIMLFISAQCNGQEYHNCEPGWDYFNDKCYISYKFPIYTYNEARKMCIAFGGTLAVVNNVEEDLYLKGYTEGKYNLWIGANDIESEGEWKWEDGTSMTYSNWAELEEQPDFFQKGGDCLQITGYGFHQWNDIPCDRGNGYICEKERFCRVVPVGVESTADVPNQHITASSNLNVPYYGRLNYVWTSVQAWRARKNETGQWLQIFLGRDRRVTGVATQGRGDSDEWVTTYRLAYKVDGAWHYVSNADYSPKALRGNSDGNTVVYHDLEDDAFTTQYVRFYPMTWHDHISMRVEVYACQWTISTTQKYNV